MYIGIDLGGTNVRFGLLDPDKADQPLVDVVSAPVAQNYQQGVIQLEQGVNDLMKKHHVEKLDGVSIGVPGLFDAAADLLYLSNLPDWSGKHLLQDLQPKLGVPLKILNDTALAALGEAEYGAGRDLPSFFFLIWGTGVGGTYVQKQHSVTCVVSTEVGHQIIEAGGRACHCGQHGCLEAYIGGWAVAEQFAHPAEITDETVWEELAQRAAVPLLNLSNIFLIPKIIFGGGFILKQQHLLERIKKKIEPQLKVAHLPELVVAGLGEQSALYGGLAVWKTSL